MNKTTASKEQQNRIERDHNTSRETAAHTSTLYGQVMRLQRTAGNRAVSGLFNALSAKQPELLEQFWPEVFVHSGPEAEHRADVEGATAFTQANHIYLGREFQQLDWAGKSRILLHELVHTGQQYFGSLGGSPLTNSELEGVANSISGVGGPAGDLGNTIGNAMPGSIQKLDRRAGYGTEKDYIRASLRGDLAVWPKFVNSLYFKEVLDENADLRQRLFHDDPEFRHWVRDPGYQPPWTAPEPVEPQVPTTPESAEEEQPATRYSEVLPMKVVNPHPKGPAIRVVPPALEPAAPTRPRKMPQEDFMESFNRTATLRQRAEVSKPIAVPSYYSPYERAIDKGSEFLDVLPGARLGRLLAELIAGHRASGHDIDRWEKAKEAAVESVMIGTMLFGPEEILEKLAGERALGSAGLRAGRETLLNPGLKNARAIGHDVEAAEREAMQGLRQPTTAPTAKPAAEPMPDMPAKVETASPTATPKAKPGNYKMPEDIAEFEAILDEDELLGQMGVTKRKPFSIRKQEANRGSYLDRREGKRYPANQIAVRDKTGRRRYLDSYDPINGEIVSRKSLEANQGQIAFVDEFDMIDHFQEFALKYPRGARILDTRKTRKLGLAGKTFQGKYVFEVPVQHYPIPERILKEAELRGITIRDFEGKVYN